MCRDFYEEKDHLRSSNQRLLLVLKRYSLYITFCTLFRFRENNIVVTGVSFCTSRELKALHVSTFASYRTFVQSELHSAARQKRVFNAFAMRVGIIDAYSRSIIASNIGDGFMKCGL